jgi:hypothetical protein
VIAVPFIASTLFGIYENHVCGVELDELEAKSKQPARVDP